MGISDVDLTICEVGEYVRWRRTFVMNNVNPKRIDNRQGMYFSNLFSESRLIACICSRIGFAISSIDSVSVLRFSINLNSGLNQRPPYTWLPNAKLVLFLCLHLALGFDIGSSWFISGVKSSRIIIRSVYKAARYVFVCQNCLKNFTND